MGRPTKYVVALKDEERERLQALVRRGKAAVRQVTRARILLLADARQKQEAITAALGVCRGTVQRVCKRYFEEGLAQALGERPRPGAQRRLDGKQEAFLIALACSDAPEGRTCWTMQLLAGRLVELGVVEAISDETVRRVLKKGGSSRGGTSSGASER
jgi:transposase